jgi:predicted amidophosphoribosyltransferase
MAPAPGAGARLPRPCALCGQWDRADLCAGCQQRFADDQPARCPQCALPAASGQRCGACVGTPPPFHHTVAVADYRFPWDRLIARFKFQQQPELATLLAGVLAAARCSASPACHAASLVLPVPLSPGAWPSAATTRPGSWRGGWPRTVGCTPMPDCLLRLRDTPHQVQLDRAPSAANLRGAFHVGAASRATSCGRTADRAGRRRDDHRRHRRRGHRALLAAGAARVQVWVVARTPAGQGTEPAPRHNRGPCSTSCSCSPRSRPTPAT